MKRIRVLQIISGFAVEGPLGGIERFGIELVRNLDNTKFEPILCGLWRYHVPYEEQQITILQEEGIKCFFAANWQEDRPYRSFFRARKGILRYFEGQSAHLIHSHCQFGDILALLVSRQLKAQAALRTVHNEREWQKRPFRRIVLTNMMYPLFFNVETGVSQQVVNNLNTRPVTTLLRKKSLYIPNAINLQRFTLSKHNFKNIKRKELGLPNSALVIGTIGRLTPQKGYTFFLEAAALVHSQIQSTYFLIIGDGELREELENLARSLGIEDAVLFLGSRQDVEILFTVMDIFVSSSLWEGLPTVILESMASKVPVIATDVSGTRELVQNGKTGICVPPANANFLAQAILQAINQPEWMKTMAENAHSLVRNFSIAQISKQYMNLYLKLLNSKANCPK